MKRLTKQQIKVIARHYAGEYLTNAIDLGHNAEDAGITGPEMDEILNEILRIRASLLLPGKRMGTIKEIVKRVRQ